MILNKGVRVQLHPATDAWMQGDKYGEVLEVDRPEDRIRLRLDKSGRKAWFRIRDIAKTV